MVSSAYPMNISTRYWPIDAVAEWHANHQEYAVAAHALWKSLDPQHNT